MKFLPAILCLGALPLCAQEEKGFGAVDQKRVDGAISRGAAYLKTVVSPPAHRGINHSNELILYTLFHAGVPESDPVFQRYLLVVEGGPLERTYGVALQAMLLEAMDPVKYQPRIAQCAQFLVDNQCANGQWSYGEPTPAARDPAPTATTGPVRPEVASGGAKPRAKEKPRTVKKIPVRRTRQGPAAGDNSNSQYAALGLRACHDAGIQIPESTIALARNWWTASHHAPTEADRKAATAVATGEGGGPSAPGRGWCYQDGYGVCKGGPAYAAMTAGAAGAVVIYDYLQGKDWKKNKTVQSGLAWLARNWSVTENLGPSEVEGGDSGAYLYYYLYALERLGMLHDTARIGGHAWYPEGAAFLLDGQKADGSWEGPKPEKKPAWDTCFAILFLKRATKRLDVATEGSRK